MKYYAVFHTGQQEPSVLFKLKREADRYVDHQRYVWSGMKALKFWMREVEIPRPNRQKLVVVHKITWIDYVLHGLGLLLNSIKTHGKK